MSHKNSTKAGWVSFTGLVILAALVIGGTRSLSAQQNANKANVNASKTQSISPSSSTRAQSNSNKTTQQSQTPQKTESANMKNTKATDTRPDLIIKEIRLNKAWQPGQKGPRGLRVRVANVGNGDAPETSLIVSINVDASILVKNAVQHKQFTDGKGAYVPALKPGQEAWAETTHAILTPGDQDVSPRSLTEVYVIVDPQEVKEVPTGETSSISPCLGCAPIKSAVTKTVKVPDKVKESNEKNNELTVPGSAVKP